MPGIDEDCPEIPILFKLEREGVTIEKDGVLQCEGYGRELIIPTKALHNKWHDFLMNINWTDKEDGFIDLWINDKLVYQSKGKTFGKLLKRKKMGKNFRSCNSFFVYIFKFFCRRKKAISKFNGAYTYSHFCTNEPEPKYDGSRFIIEDGVISNDKGGGGRWDIKKYKLNKKGNLSIQAQRKDRKYKIKGKLDIEGQKIEGKLLAKRYSKNGEYEKDCDIVFTKVGDLPEKISFDDDRKVTEIKVTSKNVYHEISLLKDEGKKQKIRVELRNLDNLSNGLIIVLPSSTPNMDDEKFYEKQVSEFGFATAIVFGAEPRYQKSLLVHIHHQ